MGAFPIQSEREAGKEAAEPETPGKPKQREAMHAEILELGELADLFWKSRVWIGFELSTPERVLRVVTCRAAEFEPSMGCDLLLLLLLLVVVVVVVIIRVPQQLSQLRERWGQFGRRELTKLQRNSHLAACVISSRISGG